MPGAKVETQCIDLSDLESVRSFTQRALAFPGHQLDVLLNNAGDKHCTACIYSLHVPTSAVP